MGFRVLTVHIRPLRNRLPQILFWGGTAVATATDSFCQWLHDASIREHALSAAQRAVLQAAWRFRQAQGTDYYSTRLLSHFLLHCGCALKVAQIARLLGLSRPTASKQQALSSKQTIQQA